MIDALEDARKLAHGTYDDVIIVEHRIQAGASTVHVVLEMPEGLRVLDTSDRYDIDGVAGNTPPTVGASYRVTIGPTTQGAGSAATIGSSLRYQSPLR